MAMIDSLHKDICTFPRESIDNTYIVDAQIETSHGEKQTNLMANT